MTPSQEPKWISKAQAIYIHEQSISRHCGSPGIREEGLLESALARAEHFYAYGEDDLYILAATYAEGIARNHAFVDGNKRTAYSVAGLFLHLNGQALQIISVEEQIKLFEGVAAGKVSREELATFYKANTRERK